MDPRIVLTHSKSSKAGTIEEFPIENERELTVGRDPSASIRYDSDRDDLVSRRHLKITVKSTNPPEFLIADLGSRNGTFVNKQRVFGTTPLQPGDIVQVGAGGPEFEFDVSPRASDDLTRTRTANGLGTAEFTPEVLANPEPVYADIPVAPAPPKPAAAKPPKPRKNRAALLVVVLCVMVIAALSVGGVLLWRSGLADRGINLVEGAVKQGLMWWRTQKPAVASDIAPVNRDSVGLVEVSWKLEEAATGRQLFQVYAPNQRQAEGSSGTPLVPGAGPQLPVFVLLESNRIEPVLTTDPGMGRPIRGRSSGSGFAIDPNGSVITVRHLAEPWRASYAWPSDNLAGILLHFSENDNLGQAVISTAQFPQWIPSEAKFVLAGSLDKPGNASMKVDGKVDSFEVTFQGSASKSPARLIRVLDPDDIAVIGVDSAQPLPALKMNHEPLHAGDPATVISYSAGVTRTTVASERLAQGHVLSAGPTDATASGAPVLDKQGRVIAVYKLAIDEELPVPTAVPLRSF